MKKEFVVRSIDAAPDGAPYVVISLSTLKDMQEDNDAMPPAGAQMRGFTNINDMMKDINKMISGMGGTGMMGMQGNVTQLKLDMHEYKKMGLAVGDKVFLELTKDEQLGI